MKSIIYAVLSWMVCLAFAAGCGGSPDKPDNKEPAPALPKSIEAWPIDDYAYAAIDRHAINAPPEAEASMYRLAAYLTAPARTDKEKARAIYRWLGDNIAYNVQPRAFSGMDSITGAQNTLKTRKGLCDGYSSLFYELAKSAGLDVRRIRGYSKGHYYYPGRKFDDVNHEWVAVKIDGDWRLVDPTWGAGVIEDGRFVKKFDGTYFLTPPAYFLFDHLPSDPNWQLVRDKMDLEEFEAQVYPGRALLRNLRHLGFAGSDLQKATETNGFSEFPEAHHYKDCPVQVKRAPLNAHLKSGKKYVFEMASSNTTDAILYNSGHWIEMEKDGTNHYKATINPAAGVLKLSVQRPSKGDEYWPLLVYSVD